MYVSIPTTITISGNIKGNLDPDLTKVDAIRALAKQLGLDCTVDFGTPEVNGVHGAGIEFPDDASAPEVTTIDEIEDVLCVLGAQGYIWSARNVFSAHGELNHQWVREHLGYFKSLEPKLRDAIMASWNPTGDSRPTRKEGARLLGVSPTTMHQRVKKAFREVRRDFENRRNDYIINLSPDAVIDQPVAILDINLLDRARLRQAGLKTLRDVCELTESELKLKLREEGRNSNMFESFAIALQKFGLEFKAE